MISFGFFFALFISLWCSPQAPAAQEQEASWSDEENDVVHLTDETFGDALAETSSLLVMFYAPCKFGIISPLSVCLSQYIDHDYYRQ